MNYKVGLLHKVKAHIKSGGVIAYPTESCFGFGCDPHNYSAIQKIIKIKQRNKNKGFIVIAGKMRQLSDLILPLSPSDLAYVNELWPGPYSLVVKTVDKAPAILTGKHKTVAVRVTRHKLVQQMCNYLKMPMVSTSANKSGFIAVKSYRDCVRQFGKSVMVLPGNTLYAKKPSTIIVLETKAIIRK